jgi:hypothetical protein
MAVLFVTKSLWITDALFAAYPPEKECARVSSTCADWGEIEPRPIESGYDFWALFDELVDDESGFVNNRGIIANAYREGQLFGLRLSETDSMRNRQARTDPIFCAGSYNYLLPTFCVTGAEGTCDIIWTHTREAPRLCEEAGRAAGYRGG